MKSTGRGDENDLGVDDHYVVDHFLGWLPARDTSRAFAGLIQFNQTHFPYYTDRGHRPFGETERRDLYDNALHYLDLQIQRVVDGLKAAGVYDQTLIVLTSDHGEGFKEHGMFGHLNCQYREGIQVPMIWFVPPVLAGDSAWSGQMSNLRLASRERKTSNLDVLPTLLDFSAIWSTPGMGNYSSGFAGVSLLRQFPRDRALICSNLTETSRRQRGLSVIIDNWHYILDMQGERIGMEELYNWSDDPGEARNVIATIPPDLRQRISEFLDSFPVSQRVRKSLTTK
jgi:arylsulfatase A-like enzyme